MVKRWHYLFWGTPDRVITTISLISGLIGLALAVFTYQYPSPPPVYVVVRDDTIISTLLLIIVAISIKYYKKDKMAEWFRVALHAQWESHHHLIHNFRDHYFRDIRKKLAQDSSMAGDELSETQKTYMENVFRTILQDTREAFLNYYRVRGLKVENDLSITVKMVIPAEDAQAILHSIKGDQTHILNKSKNYIVTAYRDPYTWGAKPERGEIKQIIYDISKDNTTFDEIVSNGKSYYFSNNLKLEYETGRYRNQNPEWQNNYNAVLAVPIRFRRQGDTRAAVIYGAISIDSKNPNNYELFDSKHTFHLLASSADILALMFGLFDVIELTRGAKSNDN